MNSGIRVKLSFFILAAFVTSLGTLLAEDCGPLDEFLKDKGVEWVSDTYDLETHLSEFWNIHKRFGIVKINNDVFLIGKNREIAQEVIQDLKKISGNEKVLEVNIPEVEGVAYKISHLVPDLILKMHGEQLNYHGPNCWNFCMRRLTTEGSIPMSAAEFRHWLSSPLSIEVKNFSELKMGDVMAFRDTKASGFVEKQEQHGAVFLSPRLAMAKYAMGSYYPPRLLDIREAISAYYPAKSNSVKVYRVQPIIEAAKKLTSPSSKRLNELLERAFALEREADHVFFGKNGFSENLKIVGKFEPFGDMLLKEVEQPLKDLENKNDLNSRIEWTIWRGLQYKAYAYRVLHLSID